MTQTEGILSDAINGPMQALFEALMPVIVVGLTLQFVCMRLHSCTVRAI